MTEQEQINFLRQEVNDLKQIVNFFVRPDKYLFQRNIEMFNGRNIVLGNSVGTKIGTSTTQKLAFFNSTPIIQQVAITTPSGGAVIDSQARSSIGEVITLVGASKFGLNA